ncbi:MAG: serine--tRNA ligase, partial [Clostridia bacterium]|nr:serine--tRNA ligase [Clostridia bacterium]
MLDIKFICENADLVKENIRKKFKEDKLPLVDEVIALYGEKCAANGRANELRANRNRVSRQIGILMAQGKREEAEEMKRLVNEQAEELRALEEKETELSQKVTALQMKIPNIVDASVPVGRDDSENVEVEQFGAQTRPDFEIPYHTDIMQAFCGIDKDAAGRVAGEGFYYLMGDIARLHSAVLAYARDFMIDKGFTYCIPPYMIRSKVVTG